MCTQHKMSDLRIRTDTLRKLTNYAELLHAESQVTLLQFENLYIVAM